MNKNKLLIVGLLMCILVVSVPAASAFDFVGWLKNVLGIQSEAQEVFVPEDEIVVEGQEEEPAVSLEDILIDVDEADTGESEDVTEETEERTEVAEPEEAVEETATEEETPVEEEAEVVEPEAPAVDEKKVGTDATVVIIEETEKVNLVPEAYDPDEDSLEYSYTSPLGKDGTWQTTYGNEGEYVVTVTATDGELSASKDVLLIVNKKEEAPTIDSFVPVDLALKVNEDSELEFNIKASDLNKDDLTYSWTLDDKEVSTKTSFKYSIGYNDAGEHSVKVIVSDEVLDTERSWEITVANVNRKPIMEELSNIVVKETETVKIDPKATDPDGSKLKFTISDPVGDDGVWETTYDNSGVYDVKVTVSDGEDEVSQTIKVTVQNVNRPPVITTVKNK